MSKKAKYILPIPILLLAGLIFGFVVYQTQTAPVDIDNHEIKKVVVPKGASVDQIAAELKQQQLIKQPLMFKIWVRLNDLETDLQAGTFELSPSMTLQTIVNKLTEGTNDVWVTFPEGLRREEIAESLASYPLPDFDQDLFLSQTVGLEGQLFPDTYLLPKMSTTQSIINLLTETFETKINSLEPQLSQSDRTKNQILTMASILEREARGYEQMQLVSGVLWKRLELGMPLQADATLQYAAGYNQATDSWWSAPTADSKKVDSPFNTYAYPGLPPHPICNPGLDAIRASLNPIQTNYLYYLHDNQGTIHFAETLQQHNQNVNQYLR